MIEESKRKILSAGGALSLVTDLTVWLQNGPASMVRALDLFERRQVVFRASVTAPPKQQNAAAMRTMATAGALAIALVFVAATGGMEVLATPSFFTYIAVGFVTSWSLWLLVSLWRQLRARPDSAG